MIDIDRSPIGRTPRSIPPPIPAPCAHSRLVRQDCRKARRRGYEPGRFSFNAKAAAAKPARATASSRSKCISCRTSCRIRRLQGKRYNRETLDVKFRDNSIADVLDMTVEAGAELFKAVRHRRKLEDPQAGWPGLHHRSAGHTTLSGGGPALSKELSRRATGAHALHPGRADHRPHFHDVKLLQVLQELVDTGNTVVVIEHNLEVIKTADYIIDLGPEGGDGGGEIVAQGTPEDVAKNPRSYTGQYLKTLLKAREPAKRLRAAE